MASVARVSSTKAIIKSAWTRGSGHGSGIVHPTRALDIGLIRDEANVATPREEPRVEYLALVPTLRTDRGEHRATPAPRSTTACRALLTSGSMGPDFPVPHAVRPSLLFP
ncbi:hypothetical protein H5410_045751 [Solanum commersonii]|uniref:Uncharacterized protein n=1 Tax=Solanum commersonii TaxID=4109 RepID=A0A9J5XCH4_SOLCO|nr:hypothetical protein H5410_045751 [Solanum commersonii]